MNFSEKRYRQTKLQVSKKWWILWRPSTWCKEMKWTVQVGASKFWFACALIFWMGQRVLVLEVVFSFFSGFLGEILFGLIWFTVGWYIPWYRWTARSAVIKWCPHMGVSKNRGTPKWMVYFMENPIEIHDLGVPLFLETPISSTVKWPYLWMCLILRISRFQWFFRCSRHFRELYGFHFFPTSCKNSRATFRNKCI